MHLSDAAKTGMKKLISFRLTEQEYNRFRDLCYSQGIRNASEMARTAINLLIERPAGITEDSLRVRVSQLESRMEKLVLELQKLYQNQH